MGIFGDGVGGHVFGIVGKENAKTSMVSFSMDNPAARALAALNAALKNLAAQNAADAAAASVPTAPVISFNYIVLPSDMSEGGSVLLTLLW